PVMRQGERQPDSPFRRLRQHAVTDQPDRREGKKHGKKQQRRRQQQRRNKARDPHPPPFDGNMGTSDGWSLGLCRGHESDGAPLASKRRPSLYRRASNSVPVRGRRLLGVKPTSAMGTSMRRADRDRSGNESV